MYWQKRFERANPDEEIEQEIKEIFEDHNGNYGYRRIEMILRSRGKTINHKKIQRIKKKLNLQSTKFTRKSRRYNSYKGNVGKIAKNLLRRRFNTTVPHQKITTDTTEFKYYIKSTCGKITIKKAYLDPFLDMYNSEIISYRVSPSPNAQAVSDALVEAIERTSDCKYRRTFHSDQGWAYQMYQYRNLLKKSRIYQSMSRKGNCLDNSVMENFFGVMKQEMYYGETFESFDALKNAIDDYILYYNNERIKSKLKCSPVIYRLKHAA